MTIASSVLIAAAFPISFALFGVTSSDVVHAAETGAQNLGDLLSQRSPGARTAAQLTKTKKAQHALAKLREASRPAAPSVAELAKVLLPPAEQPPASMPVALLQAGGPPPLSAIVAPPPGGAASPPGGVIGSPPGGSGASPPGGGGPATFPTSEPKEVVPAPSAVPEPGTWATMLLGFGLVGWRVRRRGKARPIAVRA